MDRRGAAHNGGGGGGVRRSYRWRRRMIQVGSPCSLNVSAVHSERQQRSGHHNGFKWGQEHRVMSATTPDSGPLSEPPRPAPAA
jgi:hypothetical protein